MASKGGKMAGAKKRRPYKRYILLVAVVLLIVLGIRPGDRSLYAPPIEDGVTIYLINNSYHSDVTVPTAELAKLGGATDAAARQLGPAPWVAVGWGDASFYSNTGFSFARAMDGLRALFMPGNASVVHLYGISRRPDQAFGADGVTPITLSRKGFERMVARVDRSFAVTPGKAPEPWLKRGQGELFFASTEHFSILKICNHWTAELLHAGGLRMLLLLDTFPAGLLFDVSLNS
jgi:uncharacterized protein (TIGR02117 family)